jgi:REP element-mobilizing transposase RayT
MPYDRDHHHRRSVRLKYYDYTQAGTYFITICTQDRVSHFNTPHIREIATAAWVAIPDHAAGVTLDEWVIMPNHLHGLLVFAGPTDTTGAANIRPHQPGTKISPPRRSLAVILRTYKTAVTLACRAAGHTHFAWQTGYYDHVIRDGGELNRVRLYIQNNPAQWALDHENPEYKSKR